MDNSELRELLADLAKDDPAPRFAGALEIRCANLLREHGARLLADSDELARLRAEIAGAPVRDYLEAVADYMEFELHAGDVAEWARAGEKYALLRLPAGESQDTTTRAGGGVKILCLVKHRWRYHGHYLIDPQRTCRRCGKYQRKHFGGLNGWSIFMEWDRWI